MKPPKPATPRPTSDPRRSLNFTSKGVPRLSASSGQAVRLPPEPVKK